MTYRWQLPVLILGLGVTLPAFGGGPPKPPTTLKGSASSTYFGVEVPDPYRWLEFSDARGVRRWIKAQNAYTDRMLSGFPQSRPMAALVRKLALTSTQRSDPERSGNLLFYLQQTPPQGQAVLVARTWPDGKAHVLVNPNKTPGNALTGYWPSPNGH